MTNEEGTIQALMAKAVADLGAAASGALIILGDRLGLFRALADSGAVTSLGLAEKTGTNERLVREWLATMAASGYVTYDAEAGAFAMTPEQVALLGDPESPLFLASAYLPIASLYKDEPLIAAAFAHGQGVGWHEHSEDLFHGTERFFSGVYRNFLVSSWLPSLNGVVDKLVWGGRAADVGCGHGAATLLMARAFPDSHFSGFDQHEVSIEQARKRLHESGLPNVTFKVTDAKQYPRGGYDLVMFLDCFHEMGDPVGVARYAREVLAEDGTVMLVEQIAGDRLEDNLHPIGRLLYSFSTLVCTPASMSQGEKDPLGAQAGVCRLREIFLAAGFSSFRQTSATPFHMVLEAKP